MFQTQVGFQQQWQFPSPHPWEQPWWVEAVCSAYSSSNQQKQHKWKRHQQQCVFSTSEKFALLQSDTYRMDKSLQKVLAEKSQGHGLRKELHIRSSLHTKEQEKKNIELSRIIILRSSHTHTHTHPCRSYRHSYLHEVAVEEGSLWQDQVGTDAASNCLLDSYQLLLSQVNAGM